MMSLKLLVIALSIAMLMAVSACSEPPPPTPTPVPMPMLNSEQAMMAVLTHTAQVIGSLGGNSPFKVCLPSGWSAGDPADTEASYKNNGKWTVEVGSCLFIVDDYTGQVTGP